MSTNKINAGLEILKRLSISGFRIFTRDDALIIARSLGIRESYLNEVLSNLCTKNWITRIKRGLYAFSFESGMSSIPHEFEIAWALAPNSAIGFWTAMHYHHLTQQTPNTVFSLSTKKVVVPKLLKNQYVFVQVKSEKYFGIEKIWIHNAQIKITDKEKTIVDALSHPEHCGDIFEVVNMFETQNIDLKKIIQYALRLDKAVVSRLGWCLEKSGIPLTKLNKLQQGLSDSYRKLNPHGTSKGYHDYRWKLIINI